MATFASFFLAGAILLGDVDGNGFLDAFVVNAGGPNRVWLNNGSGVFSDSGLELGNNTSKSIKLGDLDGDGDLDAFVGNSGANKVYSPPTPSIGNSWYLHPPAGKEEAQAHASC